MGERVPQHTLCLKNDSDLAYYNFDEHQTILIFFGKNVGKKVSSQNGTLF